MRQVLRQHPALRDDIGDLTTRRPLPSRDLPQLDPFLFLNHHGPQVYAPGNHSLPFGPHPHRGFETVSFILKGEMAHLDSGGHESVIGEGGIQWMTAGSGLIHAEISPESFKQSGGPLEILQLWVNLPARLKMTQPSYTGLQRADIPAIAVPGGTVNLISGEFREETGPYTSLTGVAMMTVELEAGASLTLPAPSARTVFLYVVTGEPVIGRTACREAHLVELDQGGDEVEITTQAPVTLLYGHADPIGEPVVAHGPFVMNTREEIHAAIQDYQAGKFGAIAG
ncbi:pirin family protein [Novosphingobium mangrovi (ex Hu et al. 2023)]|uniref:Pirin family protein n=1 Tax=Novosphingobium mangrovi (ex Hu et al. 2023) TaxID=2930094 RepID=A0ABT0A967_9SPHN|nr:pirin family protein [Novosphingobium mangrovi (ex Hu et al. 2023)]MCJ1959740.1 pirin family protein [Novosphingobium mangrovi (ex Hu et al. 2023)]